MARSWFLFIVLLTSVHALSEARADQDYQTVKDSMACGGESAVLKSTCTRAGVLRCMRQELSLLRQNPERGHVTESVIDIPRDKTYLLVSWACLHAKSGRDFFLLDYVCSFDTLKCTDEEQKEEWQQLVDMNGINLDIGHDLRQPGHEAVMEKAGLSHIMEPHGLKMRAFGFALHPPPR